MKLRSDPALLSKLSSQQQQVICFNHCLMLLMMNKTDECRELLTKLQEKYPENDLFPLLYATILYKNRKYQKAQGSNYPDPG
jgi:predicted Zn-dependent protease